MIIIILYFRLTRKYDAMFPEQNKIFPASSLISLLGKTGYYTWSSAFKGFAKLKRNQAYYNAYNQYDFYGNSSALDRALGYILLFCIVFGLGSALAIFIITRILGIEI